MVTIHGHMIDELELGESAACGYIQGLQGSELIVECKLSRVELTGEMRGW